MTAVSMTVSKIYLLMQMEMVYIWVVVFSNCTQCLGTSHPVEVILSQTPDPENQ